MLDGGERRRERVDGTPVLRCEQREADFARRERDVGVGDARCECYLWRGEGVVGWEGDAELPEAAFCDGFC